jgi:hypothetical protein
VSKTGRDPFFLIRKVGVQEVHRGSKYLQLKLKYGSQEANEGDRPTQFSKGGVYECGVAALCEDASGYRIDAVHLSKACCNCPSDRTGLCGIAGKKAPAAKRNGKMEMGN